MLLEYDGLGVYISDTNVGCPMCEDSDLLLFCFSEKLLQLTMNMGPNKTTVTQSANFTHVGLKWTTGKTSFENDNCIQTVREMGVYGGGITPVISAKRYINPFDSTDAYMG